jgi:hypothetical protein
MTDELDNDTDILILAGAEGDPIDSLSWAEARSRLTAYFRQPTEPSGWSELHAEDVLCAIFTGKAML